VITKRICLSLQRRDNDKLLHGIESGNILRTPEGEFIEIHTPLPAKQQAVILSKHDIAPLAIETGYDENGVADPKRRSDRLRAKLSQWWYGDNIALPSRAELAAAQAHAAHDYHEQESVVDDYRNLEITSEPVLHSAAIGGHEENPHIKH
jgi:ubiquinol-cytochrome c reductase cytochrome b subunit